MEVLLDQVKRHWAAQKARPGRGAGADQIDAFERRYQVTMPDDLRAYFCTLNGLEAGQHGEMVDEFMSFWNLDQVRSVAEELECIDGRDLFVFADHSLWAHAYAIRLSMSPHVGGEVYLVGGRNPLRVAASFDAFLRGYLANDLAMLFGSGKSK